jgi:hypothetical protein
MQFGVIDHFSESPPSGVQLGVVELTERRVGRAIRPHLGRMGDLISREV